MKRVVFTLVLFLFSINAHAEHDSNGSDRPLHPDTQELRSYIADNPKLQPFYDKWLKDNPRATATQVAMAVALVEAGAFSTYSSMSPGACREASLRASEMLKTGQGHHGFESREPRIKAIMRKEGFDVNRAAEIEAETFGNTGSLMGNAKACVRMWKDSYDHMNGNQKENRPNSVYGHWKKAYAKNEAFCYDMKCGRMCECYGVNGYRNGDPPNGMRKYDLPADFPFSRR